MPRHSRAHPAFRRRPGCSWRRCQQRNGKTEEAIQSLDEALNEVPPELVGGVQLQRAKLLADSGRLDEAIAGYQAITSPARFGRRRRQRTRLDVRDQAERPGLRAAHRGAGRAAQPERSGHPGYARLDSLHERGERQGLGNSPEGQVGRFRGTRRCGITWALALLKIGRKDDAKAELEEALAISKDFPEAADAAAQLAGI